MLWDLHSQKLEVQLVPSEIPECAASGGEIRAVVSRNPEWYRNLCKRYPSERCKQRHRKEKYTDTKIHRQRILNLLEKLSEGKEVNSIYLEDLIEIAETYKKEWGDLAEDDMSLFENVSWYEEEIPF